MGMRAATILSASALAFTGACGDDDDPSSGVQPTQQAVPGVEESSEVPPTQAPEESDDKPRGDGAEGYTKEPPSDGGGPSPAPSGGQPQQGEGRSAPDSSGSRDLPDEKSSKPAHSGD